MRILLLVLMLVSLRLPSVGQDLRFIDTSFENASPIDWEEISPNRIRIDLMYDHERGSPNRAAGHWHFRLDAKPGCQLTLVLNHFRNVWNGKPSSPVSDATITFVSPDGQQWTSMPTTYNEQAGQIEFTVSIPDSGSLYVARLPPYRISDLEKLLAEIKDHPSVHIENIGQTVQGRPLEIIRVGDANARHRVFVRARAHPWEPGGNWVVEGMVRHLIGQTPTAVDGRGYCVYIMPMANKDGVAAGRTRFNLLGKDLNRDWNEPVDAELCPENAALERWLESMLTRGHRPHLALELHNDENGKLHLSSSDEGYLRNLNRFETLLRQKTWFREGTTGPPATTSLPGLGPGTLGGWHARYGIDAAVHELNANWIEGLQAPPSAEFWQLYGRQLCDVVDAYFD